MENKTLKESLKLDILDLDTACLEQASLFAEIGEDWAEALAERDRVKERLAAKRAEVDEKIRKDPASYGGEKVTENWVSSKISQDAEVIALNEELIQAQYNVNMLSVGKEAVEHRGNALRYLIDLYKGNYFSASSRRVPATASEAASESQLSQGASMDNHPAMLRKKRIIKNGSDS